MNIKNSLTQVTIIILICLLIFMGIGNFLLENNEKEKVARVGKEIITLNEYKSLYKNYEKQISEPNISKEQIKKLKHNLLNILIEEKLLFNLVNDLKLTIGEESIKDYIGNIKYFQNDKGEFDKKKFYETLNDLHTTEKEYVTNLKKILPTIMFITSLFKNNYPVTFGEKIDEKIYKSRYQTRIVDIIKITKDAVINIPKPDDKILLDLYKKNKSHFYDPEYRTAQYISLDLKYFKDQIHISNEEINSIIEEQELKNQRDIFNIIFPSEEKVKAAKKAFEKGEISFEQIAEKFGKTKLEETRINNITKNLLPENIREKVFALKAGEVSEILVSNFGWHIIKVENIHQISDENLINLKKNIESILANQKSFEKVNDFINQVNYKIYNGATIEEISNEYNLPIQIIGPIDTNGKGQNINSIKNSNDLISLIFSQKKDQKSYFKSIGDTVFSVKIIDITPPKMQSFEKSKESVIDFWRNEFTKEQMFKIGQKIITQLKEKADFKKTQGIKLIKNKQIHRNETEQQNY
ncbi:MAG: SurA N-terminal domain-containing protein, partial [Wolbachia pipientis]|nr:SurA N-terminal domain-containing protein [Wolbachia pipientis]